MRITLVGHASLYIETCEISLLADPVFFDPFCEGLNAVHPPREVAVENIPHYDAIFISHQHFDHFDVRTLASLDRKAEMFCPRDAVIVDVLKRLGYHKINTLSDLDNVSFGAVSLVTTPSRNPVPEMGFVLSENGNTFWNQVDTVSTLESVSKVKHLAGNIDYVMAPWQPFLETAWQESADCRFPFQLYQSLLEEVTWVGAHFVSPGANGLRFIGEAECLNHVAFPVTPARFAHDLAQLTPGTPTVLNLRPGDTAVLNNHSVHIEPQRTSWITTDKANVTPTMLHFCPSVLGSSFQATLKRPFASIPQGTPWWSIIEAIAQELDPKLQEWDVVYQLFIEYEGSLIPLWLDFQDSQATWREGYSELANYTVFISSRLLGLIAQGAASASLLVTGADYRRFDCVFRIRQNRLERPSDSGDTLKDPLLRWCTRRSNELVQSTLESMLRSVTHPN